MKRNTRELTNIFHFTFARSATPQEHHASAAAAQSKQQQQQQQQQQHPQQTSNHPDDPRPRVMVRRLLPRSYGDAMAYLEGKRRKERGIELKKAQVSEFVEFPMPME